MVKYQGVGRYQFSISVDDNHQDAFLAQSLKNIDIKSRNSYDDECCGSRVNLYNKKIINIGKFSVKSPGIVKYLDHVHQCQDDVPETCPPSRIGDLRGSANLEPDSTGILKLSFTAPGNDLDHGLVEDYTVLATRNRTELVTMKNISNHPEAVFDQFKTNLEAGKGVSLWSNFELFNEDIFVAVVAVDESGNTGKVSNVIKVHLEAPIPEQNKTTAEMLESDTVLITRAHEDFSLIVVLLSAIFLLSTLLCCGIVYFLKVWNAKKSDSSSSIGTSVTNVNGTIVEAAAATQPSENHGSNGSLSQSTPIYWSATDLLSKHESKLGKLNFSTPVYPQNLPQSANRRTGFWHGDQSHILRHPPVSLVRELFLDSISEEAELDEAKEMDFKSRNSYLTQPLSDFSIV